MTDVKKTEPISNSNRLPPVSPGFFSGGRDDNKMGFRVKSLLRCKSPIPSSNKVFNEDVHFLRRKQKVTFYWKFFFFSFYGVFLEHHLYRKRNGVDVGSITKKRYFTKDL